MMNLRLCSIRLPSLLLGLAFALPATALEPTPVTADMAFDAVATQTDPLTGYKASVALIDVRSRAEYFWVGAPTRVEAIMLKPGFEIDDDSVIEPELGKVRLVSSGALLSFRYDGDDKLVPVSKVERMDHSPIARNIPFKLWNEATASLEKNVYFGDGIAELLQEGVQVVILFCRSGGRSTACVGDVTAADIFDQFSGVYEIDDPAGNPGRGGFEATSYSNVYNGYRGFPGRLTQVQEVESVSWKDRGLPMKTSMKPLP